MKRNKWDGGPRVFDALSIIWAGFGSVIHGVESDFLSGTKSPKSIVGKKWEPRNPVPGPFSAKIRKVNQNSESRREFGK